ncbi:unnamed protein product [Prunus armeniaca]
MVWCSGPRGCALTRDVLLLDAVRLCAGVPARWLNDAPVLSSTPNQTIVTERGTDLDRQVHGLSYKAVSWWCWWRVLGDAPARCSESDGRMIYGVNEMITEMVLRRLENQGSYDILMNGFSLQSTTTPRKANKGGVLKGQSRLKRPAWWNLIGASG